MRLKSLIVASLTTVSHVHGFTTTGHGTITRSYTSENGPKHSCRIASSSSLRQAHDDFLSEEKQQDILKSVESCVYVPEGCDEDIVEEIAATESRALKGIRNNFILFKVLEFVRRFTFAFRVAPMEEEITFTNEILKVIWFEAKPLSTHRKHLIVNTILLAMKKIPALVLKESDELMTDADYTSLQEGFVNPHENQMVVKSPEECFARNAPAFCKPQSDGLSVCDLDYLGRYGVEGDTPFRYGGIAVVNENGEIVEVSGVKKENEKFEARKAVFLNSFAVHVVLVRHAGMAHVAIYQKYLMRLTTRRSPSYEKMWKSHLGPELLMKALTPERTNEVNINIQVLIGPNDSLVKRATSFTNAGITALNHEKYHEYFNLTPGEMVDDIGSAGSQKWNDACHGAWFAAQKVVDIICKDLDANELKETDLDDLAMLAWTGTFYHSFIGDFQLDNVCKGNLPFHITGEKHKQTVPYGTLSTTIGVSTMTRTLNMETLGTYFPKPEQREAWDAYQKKNEECRIATGIQGFGGVEGAPVYNAIDF